MSIGSSSNLLLKYLNEDQKFQLASDFSEDFSNEQNISGLLEILDLLNETSIELVSSKFLEYSKDFILSSKDLKEFDKLSPLLEKLSNASRSLLNWLTDIIKSTLSKRLNFLFSSSSVVLFKKYGVSLDIVDSEIDLQYSLTLLEKIFILEKIEISKDLDSLILILLLINDEDISIQTSKALRWRSTSFLPHENLIWDIIFNLLNSKENYHISNGFIQWLRFLINLNNQPSLKFNELIEKNEYWEFIQLGLISSIHEQKKYALSILRLSIQLTKIDLNNEFVSFDQSTKDSNIDQWKRFCTLYEIIGIDTALNQAEAARNDILRILSSDSYIKPSWSLSLLSVGFKANMESVRKFSMNLIYDIDVENLSIFNNKLLTNVFLKYLIEASHFQVKKINNKLTCLYGERLENFIKDVLLSIKDDDSLLSLIDNLIDLLVYSRSYFGPARIYLTSGIIKGLKFKNILTKVQILKIYKLFNSTSEDESFEIYLQSLHLFFLNHLARNQILLLIESINQFVLFNGYTIFLNNIELFHDTISINYNNEFIDIKNKGLEYQVIVYLLFNKYEYSTEFLKELSNREFNEIELSNEYNTLLNELILNPKSDYSKSSKLVDLKLFKNSWLNVNLNSLKESILNDEFNFDKFEFFEKIYSKCIEVSNIEIFTINELIELFNKISKLEYNFKEKDLIIGSYLNILFNYLKINEVEANEIISVMEKSIRFGYFKTFVNIFNIIEYLLLNYLNKFEIVSILEILESIWEFITSERLILNQKDMHLKFIKTLFNFEILKDSINNEYNCKIIEKISFEILNNSKTRRSFLPCLSKCLLNYKIGYSTEFEQTEWLIELIYKVLILIQDDGNLFKIKDLMCSKFDKEISFEDGLYERIYGDYEISSKINIISIFCLISEKFAINYFHQILNDDKYKLLRPKKQIDSTEELQRIYGFSSLLLLSKKLPIEILSEYVSKQFLKTLEIEPSPLIRSYIEWIISVDLIQNDNNRDKLFKLFENHNKPALVTSVEMISFLVSSKLNEFEFFEKFTRYLIPNCASNKPLIRHFSNSLCLSLYPLIKSKEIKLSIEPVLLKLYEDAKKSETTGKYRSGDALTWDVENDFTLTSIFGGVLKRISPREMNIAITEDDFNRYLISQELPIGKFKSPWISSEIAEIETNDKLNSTLQTKSGAWETVLDFDEQQRTVKRTELIVVSSLVDKPPNLGGICRLCDVLGTGLMTVDDLRVVKHPQFKNVAVTADYWMPMIEVKIDNIPEFMRSKKREGYTLIGLEQTDKSIVLGSETKFPIKSLILLGKEAEGIPGDLLSELDYCIEIRQRGVIRSMNIQTATAVLVHAYSSSLKD